MTKEPIFVSYHDIKFKSKQFVSFVNFLAVIACE